VKLVSLAIPARPASTLWGACNEIELAPLRVLPARRAILGGRPVGVIRSSVLRQRSFLPCRFERIRCSFGAAPSSHRGHLHTRAAGAPARDTLRSSAVSCGAQRAVRARSGPARVRDDTSGWSTRPECPRRRPAAVNVSAWMTGGPSFDGRRSPWHSRRVAGNGTRVECSTRRQAPPFFAEPPGPRERHEIVTRSPRGRISPSLPL